MGRNEARSVDEANSLKYKTVFSMTRDISIRVPLNAGPFGTWMLQGVPSKNKVEIDFVCNTVMQLTQPKTLFSGACIGN